METTDLAKLAGQGGISLAILAAFVWLVRQVGLALVNEVKGLSAKIDHHTTVDLAHHAEVGKQLAAMNGKIDGVLDQADRFTPVQSVPLSRKES